MTMTDGNQPDARRYPIQLVGEFLNNHPDLARALDRLLRPAEKIAKIPPFGCHMCGQCVLHSTGMTCPMTCPKNLRNGPCGGVRADGSCEVYPEKPCIWVQAYHRAEKLPWTDEFHDLRPPVDWTLQGTSSWINYATGRDQIVSGCQAEPRSALEVVDCA